MCGPAIVAGKAAGEERMETIEAFGIESAWRRSVAGGGMPPSSCEGVNAASSLRRNAHASVMAGRNWPPALIGSDVLKE
jgi:hypothetical protein